MVKCFSKFRFCLLPHKNDDLESSSLGRLIFVPNIDNNSSTINFILITISQIPEKTGSFFLDSIFEL